MKTRCKFKCSQVAKYDTMENIFLEPVVGGNSKENESFSKYTPSGKFEISITNEKLFGAFIPGKEYYIDIEQAPGQE